MIGTTTCSIACGVIYITLGTWQSGYILHCQNRKHSLNVRKISNKITSSHILQVVKCFLHNFLLSGKCSKTIGKSFTLNSKSFSKAQMIVCLVNKLYAQSAMEIRFSILIFQSTTPTECGLQHIAVGGLCVWVSQISA